MINELMKIYNNSRLNDGKPECIFAPTLVFNEGWLLRTILKRWRRLKRKSFPFLPYPDNVKIYSEAQLYTPFKMRSRNDKQGEKNTYIDGVVGNFSTVAGTKSGFRLDDDFKYLAVFEAKMYSPLSKGITNVQNYSQVSRTIACIINSIIRAKSKDHDNIHFVIAYPEDNDKIESGNYTTEFIEAEIEGRLQSYEQEVPANKLNNGFFQFKKQWKDIIGDINIQFITWEDILSDFEGQDDLNDFYELCKKFNR